MCSPGKWISYYQRKGKWMKDARQQNLVNKTTFNETIGSPGSTYIVGSASVSSFLELSSPGFRVFTGFHYIGTTDQTMGHWWLNSIFNSSLSALKNVGAGLKAPTHTTHLFSLPGHWLHPEATGPHQHSRVTLSLNWGKMESSLLWVTRQSRHKVQLKLCHWENAQHLPIP